MVLGDIETIAPGSTLEYVRVSTATLTPASEEFTKKLLNVVLFGAASKIDIFSITVP